MRWVAFDTETTGLVENLSKPDKFQPEITEFYGCEFNPATGEVVRELDTLVRPSQPIPEKITQITGIDDAMVADAPLFKDVAGSIKALIENADVLVAHNLSFDLDMLRLEFNRIGEPLNLNRSLHLCTVEQTVAEKGYRLNLSALHEHLFGQGFPEAHRAKNDVMALVRCTAELHKRKKVPQ